MYQYKHDSSNKQLVREKWVEYIRLVKDGDGSPLSMITLPSNEFQELGYYANEGLIEATAIEETGVLRIENGRIFCFEKDSKRYLELQSKLAGATSLNDDICSWFRNIRTRFLNGKKFDQFPFDAINLDFEGSMSKLRVSISETMDTLLLFQSKFNKPFAFFLTFPESSNTDTAEYKAELVSIIESNLNDDRNQDFINRFGATYGTIENMPYEALQAVGIIKQIIKESSVKNYKCLKCDYILYGGVEVEGRQRKRMQSLLFYFAPEVDNVNHAAIYYNDVLNSLKPPVDLENGG